MKHQYSHGDVFDEIEKGYFVGTVRNATLGDDAVEIAMTDSEGKNWYVKAELRQGILFTGTYGPNDRLDPSRTIALWLCRSDGKDAVVFGEWSYLHHRGSTLFKLFN